VPRKRKNVAPVEGARAYTGIPESNIAMRQSANAVVPEAEKLVKEYCESGGEARRKNLAAWMVYLRRPGGFYDVALKMIDKVAMGGKAMP